jgi:hypothetical protein
MDTGTELLGSIRTGIFSNPSYQVFKRLNILLSKESSDNEIAELKKIYEEMHQYIRNLEDSRQIVSRILAVIKSRYPQDMDKPSYALLKIINDEKFFGKLKNLMIDESKFYNEGNFIDWKNLLIERQKYTISIEQLIDKLESNEWKSFVRNIWSIPINLSANTFLLFQKMIFAVMPKVKEYQVECAQISQYCDQRFREMSSLMDIRTKECIERYYFTPSFKAYVWVLAQVTFIDYDVFHNDASNVKGRLFEAGFRIGMDYLFIKIMDEAVDRKLFDSRKTSLMLDDFEKAICGKDFNNFTYNDSDSYYFLDAVKSFEKHYGQDPGREAAGHYLRRVNEKFLSKLRFSRKILYAKAIGKYSADITLHDMILSGLSISTEYTTFIREKGMTGNLFDDWKDYYIDMQQGIGYDGKRFKILCVFLKQYWKTLQTLNLRAKAKFLNFCILAGMFQISELVKLKERT